MLSPRTSNLEYRTSKRGDPVKKLIPWLLAVLVFQVALQLCVGGYLSHLLAPAAGGYTVTNVAPASVSSEVQHYFSYDGSFRADVSKDAVKIYAAGSDQPAKEIDIGPTEKLTYFSWLQDRDIALAGISKPGVRGTICTLESLNLVTNSQSVAPTITGLAKGAEIAGVAYSTDTNVIYIQVKVGANSTIYRTDANNVLTRVDNTPPLIGRVANLRNEDALLYDSINTGRVYLADQKGKQWISPHDGNQYALIGTDQNDSIYIARLSNPGTSGSARMADAILVGTKDNAFTLKQQLQSCLVDSITVSYDRKITHG
jgi:hypothetical protein